MDDLQTFGPIWEAWETDEKLGEGAYGTVWKAHRQEFGMTYYSAIKHISIPKEKEEYTVLREEGIITNEDSAKAYYETLLKNLLDEINLMYTLRGNTHIVSYEDHRIIPKPDGIGYDLFIRMELCHMIAENQFRRIAAEPAVLQQGFNGLQGRIQVVIGISVEQFRERMVIIIIHIIIDCAADVDPVFGCDIVPDVSGCLLPEPDFLPVQRQSLRCWNTSGGKNTQDKVFLLSFAEANKYLNVTYGELFVHSVELPLLWKRKRHKINRSGNRLLQARLLIPVPAGGRVFFGKRVLADEMKNQAEDIYEYQRAADYDDMGTAGITSVEKTDGKCPDGLSAYHPEGDRSGGRFRLVAEP